jgi:8-oxo-dGTP pyrophosphatase MutT (NUDIX family)
MKNPSIEKIKSSLKHSPNILGKDKYFNSSVIVPLIKINNELHFLFEKRSNSIRQGGEVSFPGGEYNPELDKDFKNTAIRETVEEIGISKKKIQLLGKLGTMVAPMGVTVEPFVAFLDIKGLNELSIDKNEVEKVFTLPVKYFIENQPWEYSIRMEMRASYINDDGKEVELFPVKKLGLPERYSKSWRSDKNNVLVYQTSVETVWGITAMIVYEFCKIISRKR